MHVRKFFEILFLLIGLGGSLALASVVWWQHHAITSFVPVPAHITLTDLITHRSSKSTSYEPKITYVFTYKNQEHSSSQVLPFSESSDYAWAKNIIDHFPENADATAYINPNDPSESILWRVHSWTPYAMLIVFLLIALFSIYFMIGVVGGSRKVMQAIPLDADGRSLLLPQRELRKVSRDRLYLLIGITLTCDLPWLHFMLVAEERGWGTWLITIVLGIITAFLVSLTLRARSTAGHLSDARLIVNPAPLPVGGTLDIQAEIDAYQTLQVKTFSITLACVEVTMTGSGKNRSESRKDCITRSTTLVEKSTINAGDVLTGATQFSIAGEPPHISWDNKKKTYPYWVWELRVKAELTGTPDYAAIFPLTVQLATVDQTKAIDAGPANQ